MNGAAARLCAAKAIPRRPSVSHFVEPFATLANPIIWKYPLTAIDSAAIYDAFLTAAHARVYGHSTRVPAKIVNLRTVHEALS